MKLRLLLLFFCISYSSSELNGQDFSNDTVFISTDAGKLGGILTTPLKSKKPPVVLIIPGSGPTDKDGNSAMLQGKNNSLKMVAESLALEGIASLRFDKRGIGLSMNAFTPENQLLFDHFIIDADAWLKYLIDHPKFKKVGIIGHSQGSLIGMRLARQNDIKAFASIAGASFSIDETLRQQLKGNPNNPDTLVTQGYDIISKLKKGEKVEDLPFYFQSLFRPSIQAYMTSWMRYNPVEEVSEMNVPVLVVNGSTDLQVGVEDAQRIHISSRKSKLVIVKGMNHIMKESSANRAENIATYENPDLPLHPEFEEALIKFFKKHF